MVPCRTLINWRSAASGPGRNRRPHPRRDRRRTRHRPKILLGRWSYATRDGVGSGREIARLVELYAASWLCGGVAVACHRLDDFRGDHGDVFNEPVIQLLARLMKPARLRSRPARRTMPTL